MNNPTKRGSKGERGKHNTVFASVLILFYGKMKRAKLGKKVSEDSIMAE